MLASKHPAGLDRTTENERPGWEDLEMDLEEHGRLRLKFATALQHHIGTRESKEHITNHNVAQQVQRQETSLAQDPHRYLSDSPTMLEQDAHVRGRPSQHNLHINHFSDRTGEIEAAGMAWHC